MSARKSPARDSRREAAIPPARGLPTGWAAAVLALLVVLFFHEVTLGGRTFVSPDATQPLGFVRAGERSLAQDHVYPLWNPYVFLGMPSFSSGAYNPLIYPPDWPLALIAKVVPLPDMTWMLLYYFLGGLFTFLLAREWGARPEGALLGAAAFVFAPNLVAVGSHGHGSQLVNSAYLPLLLWLAARWLRRGALQDLGLLALAGGFQMLRGHVQIAFYSWLAVALLGGVEWIAGLGRDLPRRSARLLGLALAAALAFGLAGFFNLPLRDYARYSIRGGGEGGGVGIEYATQWSLSPVELPTVAVPGWSGFGGQLYWGGMPFTDYPNAFVGIVTVLFAVAAFAGAGGARAPRVFAAALAALALMISFGRNFPLYGFLYDHFPLFNKFRVPVMIVLLFQIAAALGLAWGWTAVLTATAAKGGREGRGVVDRLILGAAAALVALLLVGVVGAGAWAGPYERLAAATHPGYPPEAARIAYAGWTGDLARACLIGLGALGAAWLARRGRITPALASVVVLALLLVELWPVSGRVMKPTIGEVAARDLDAGRDDAVRFLEQAGPPESFRILPVVEFQSNRFAGFGISSLGGYHAAKPRRFQDFFERNLANQPLWLRLLNVRFLLLPQPLQPVPDFLREAHRGESVIYEMPGALPRVTVVGSYHVITPAVAILDSVAAGTSDAARVTFLDHDPGIALGPVEGAVARITKYRLNQVEIEVDTPGPALVRLADAWYPDWTATVDGRRAEVLCADYLLRAVAVPAGRHAIVMRFVSPALQRGLWLSIGSLAAIVALIGAGWWWGRRRRPAPDAEAVTA